MFSEEFQIMVKLDFIMAERVHFTLLDGINFTHMKCLSHRNNIKLHESKCVTITVFVLYLVQTIVSWVMCHKQKDDH